MNNCIIKLYMLTFLLLLTSSQEELCDCGNDKGYHFDADL